MSTTRSSRFGLVEEGLEDRPIGGGHTEDGGDGRGDEVGVLNLGQGDEEHSMGERLQGAGRDLECPADPTAATTTSTGRTALSDRSRPTAATQRP